VTPKGGVAGVAEDRVMIIDISFNIVGVFRTLHEALESQVGGCRLVGRAPVHLGIVANAFEMR
jgi:hypothetical protein